MNLSDPPLSFNIILDWMALGATSSGIMMLYVGSTIDAGIYVCPPSFSKIIVDWIALGATSFTIIMLCGGRRLMRKSRFSRTILRGYKRLGGSGRKFLGKYNLLWGSTVDVGILGSPHSPRRL